MDYRPNIGARGRRVRHILGALGFLTAVVMALAFLFRAWTPWRFMVFFPLAGAATSWLEARRRTCVVRAVAATVEGDDGSVSPAATCDVGASRTVASRIVRDAVIIGAAGAALVAAL